MKHIWEEAKPTAAPSATRDDKRHAERRSLTLPARLAWKDSRGVNRFASVVTRDVSEFGVFVETQSALSIPLFRLVHFQLEPTARGAGDIPATLRQGRILSAVYRVSHSGKQSRHGIALRLMVDPKRMASRSFSMADSGLAAAANS